MKNKEKKGDIMKKEESTVNFDLSALSLNELIKVYKEIEEFEQFLEDAKIVTEEEKAAGEDE
jgi:hypothetical protein